MKRKGRRTREKRRYSPSTTNAQIRSDRMSNVNRNLQRMTAEPQKNFPVVQKSVPTRSKR